jgi:Patatin-like phospholipase
MSGDSTESKVTFFENAAKETFGRSRAGSGLLSRALVIFGRYQSQYSARPLSTALSNYFREDTSLFAPAKSRHFQSTTRVAVTTARDEGETECLIANYNRPLGDWTRFEREDDAAKDMKICDAALATSAAPFYLPPFLKQPGNTDYVDGAVYANCPAKVAIEEKDKLWPDDGTSLDILLSLGTGRQSKKKPKIPKTIRYGVFTPVLKMFERQMDTEKIWDELHRTSPANVKARLHRLNPPIQGQTGEYVDIDHHKELEHLMKSVSDWTTTNGAAYIRYISYILIANLFFFEPDPRNLPEEGRGLCGSVRCRLQHESEAVRVLLADKVVGFWHATVTRAEVPELRRLVNGRWGPVRDILGATRRPSQMILEEGNTKKFRLNFQLPPSHNGAAYQVLAVQLEGEPEKIAISGFPATLEELSLRSKGQWLQ